MDSAMKVATRAQRRGLKLDPLKREYERKKKKKDNKGKKIRTRQKVTELRCQDICKRGYEQKKSLELRPLAIEKLGGIATQQHLAARCAIFSSRAAKRASITERRWLTSVLTRVCRAGGTASKTAGSTVASSPSRLGCAVAGAA